MHGTFVPHANGNAIVRASSAEGAALEFLGGIDDDLLRAPVHLPGMIDATLCQPGSFAAHRVRQTKRDRQS
jgi:hypothetical protein